MPRSIARISSKKRPRREAEAAINSKKRISTMVVISYAAVYIIWGSTYFFIRLSVQTIKPFDVVGLRFLAGGLIFLLLCLCTGRLKKIPSLRQLGSSALLGMLLLVGGNGMVTLAEQKVDSYLAALIIASTPLAVAFFDRVLFRIKLKSYKIVGIFAGVSGAMLLLYDGRSLASSFNPHVLFAVMGLVSWAFATSIGSRMKVPSDSFVNSAVQMLVAGTVCTIWMVFAGERFVSVFRSMSLVSGLSVLYLAVFGSLGFIAYNYLIKNEPAIRVVSYAFVNPLIAVLLGLVLGGEKVMPYMIFGIPLIMLGLFLTFYGGRIFSRVDLSPVPSPRSGEGWHE